jgi:hypothetical protein
LSLWLKLLLVQSGLYSNFVVMGMNQNNIESVLHLKDVTNVERFFEPNCRFISSNK